MHGSDFLNVYYTYHIELNSEHCRYKENLKIPNYIQLINFKLIPIPYFTMSLIKYNNTLIYIYIN